MSRLVWVRKLACCQCQKPTSPYKLFETCHHCQHVPCGGCKVRELPLNAVEAAMKLEARSTKENEDPDEERHLGWMASLQRLHGSMENLVLKKQKKTFQ